jgi:CDP-2,3-bis-(O-geranylgeranyl)-sn-glycerol synthase
MRDVIEIGYVFYTFFPAYFTNAIPVLFGKGTPLDFHHNFTDGYPIFGRNKTIRGTFSGLIGGTLVGLIQNRPLLGFLLSLGAVLGDLVAAFFKRRLRLDSGASLPIVDQLDFVAGALLLSFPLSPFNIKSVFYIVITTPFIHLLTNYFAYTLKLKDVPY